MDDVDILVDNILEPSEKKTRKWFARKRVKRSQPAVEAVETGTPIGPPIEQESVSESGLGRVATDSHARYRLGIVISSNYLPSSFGYQYEQAHNFIYSIVSHFVGRNIAQRPMGIMIKVYPNPVTDEIRIIASSPTRQQGFDEYAEGQEILLKRLTDLQKEEIMLNFRGTYGAT